MPKPLTTDDLIRMGCQWEYNTVESKNTTTEGINEMMCTMGKDGWELVAAIGTLYHFKRRLPWQSGDTGAAS